MLPRRNRQVAKNRGETEKEKDEGLAIESIMRYGNHCCKCARL